MRLSKEDEKGSESSSIETQRKILRAYCIEHNFYIYGEYIDDGYSGATVSARPAFLAMMDDISLKKINIVLTKDLSRLGRNAGDTGTLLDTVFPRKRVRFISVTEGIDTYHRDRNYNIVTPVHNLTNELYSADISLKIRSALRAKMDCGEYIGSFAPFGYKKDAQNKNRLVTDEANAPTVRRIFSLASEGNIPSEIANILNSEHISSPSGGEWSSSSVGKLLRNETYLGHTVQGKTEKPSFKSRCSLSRPKSEWIKVENTHEPIISADTWQTVRRRMAGRRLSRSTGFANIFSGTAFCADCGRAMSSASTRKKGSPASLVCGGYKAHGKRVCTSHSIDYAALFSAVKAALSAALSLTEDEKERLLTESASALTDCGSLEQRLASAEKKLTGLFADKYSGAVPLPQFDSLLPRFQSERDNALRLLEEARQKSKDEAKTALRQRLSLIDPVSDLTPEILFTFVDKITVCQAASENGVKKQTVNIYFKFDCAENLFEYEITK